MKTSVLISGATGGLGKAFAVECARRGYSLYLTDLCPEPLGLLADALRRTYGAEVRWRACDLTDAADRASLFDSIRADRGRFWALVNVAGTDHEGLFCELSREHVRAILRLNVEGTLEMTHALLSMRDPAAPFRIINVASLAAFYPMPYKATYAASKRFLLDFSRALREELAGEGVSVTALCPAGLPTTSECLAAISAQGVMGWVTTRNIGGVAAETLNAALRGRPVYIPGALNRFLASLGGLVPPALVAHFVGSRWKSARQKRAGPGSTSVSRLASQSA